MLDILYATLGLFGFVLCLGFISVCKRI